MSYTFLNTGNFTESIKKMFEVGNGYFINGQYYDKKTLTPIPFRQYPIIGECSNLSLDKNAYLESGKGINNNKGKTIIRDDKNPNISYCFCKYNSSYLYPYKIEEKDYDIKVTQTSYINDANAVFKEFIDQDDDFLYIVTGYSNSGSCNRIYKLSKSEMRNITNYTWNSSYGDSYKILKSNKEEIIVLMVNSDYQSLSISSVDKSNLSAKRNFTLNYPSDLSGAYNDSFNYKLELSDPIIKGNEATLYGIVLTDYSKSEYSAIKVTVFLDKVGTDYNNSYKIEKIETNMSLLGDKKIPASYDFNRISMNFLEEKNGLTYLNLIKYNNTYDRSYESYDEMYGIYTFLIEEELKEQAEEEHKEQSEETQQEKVTKATLVHFERFKPICRNYLRTSDGSIITANSEDVSYYRWNNLIQGYQLTNTIGIKPTYIGLNEFEELFIMDSDYKIYVCSPTIPSEIIINFEKDYYKYEGEDISSYVEFEIKNFEGKNLEKPVVLSLTGDAVFSNGKKEIKETSSSVGKKNVAITIKGSSHFSVIAKYDE